MDQLLRDLRAWYHALLARIAGAMAEAPPGTLQLTGVLGLAALLYGLYTLRGGGRSHKPDDDRGRRQHGSEAGASGSGASSAAAAAPKPQQGASVSGAAGAAADEAGLAAGVGSKRSLGWAVSSQLAGVRAVTLSAPGVLLREWTPNELQESAVLRPDAAAVVREVARGANVFVITHVLDDIGEATVRGALEAGGLVGTAPGQIPEHRLLFCSTLEGKTSIVRQLEPELHIDGHPHTIEGLRRFMPQLLHIRQPGEPAAAPGAPNVGSAASLIEVFQG